MRRLLILKVALVFVLAFVVVGGYFWYLYFDLNEGKTISDTVRLELLNNGAVNYFNAIFNEEETKIPTYYFRVKNSLNSATNYTLIFNEIKPTDVNDGCDSSTYYQRNELKYELKLDNKVIKTGRLSDIKDNVLDSNIIQGNTTNDYSLKISLADEEGDASIEKHYHYSVNLKENNEKVS